MNEIEELISKYFHVRNNYEIEFRLWADTSEVDRFKKEMLKLLLKGQI